MSIIYTVKLNKQTTDIVCEKIAEGYRYSCSSTSHEITVTKPAHFEEEFELITRALFAGVIPFEKFNITEINKKEI